MARTAGFWNPRALGCGLLLVLLPAAAAIAAGPQIPTRPSPTPAKPPTQLPPPPSQTAPPKTGESFAELQKQLADAMRTRDLVRALTIAERQSQLYPTELKATADLGNLLLLQGQIARAEQVLTLAVTQQNKVYTGNAKDVRGAVLANLGQIALDRKQNTEAVSFFQRAVDNAPTSARPRFLLASAYLAMGNSARGLQELRAAFGIDATAARPLDYLLLARGEREAKKFDGAAETLERGIEAFPLDMDLRIERALLHRAGKRPADAVYELLYIRMIAPPDSPAIAAAGDQLQQIRAESEKNSSSEIYMETDHVFVYLDDAAANEHEQGLGNLLDAIRLNGRDPFVPRLLLAMGYRETGRFAAAERLLVSLLKQDPQSLPVLVALADLYLAEGRKEGAQSLLRRASGIDPRNPRLRELQTVWAE